VSHQTLLICFTGHMTRGTAGQEPARFPWTDGWALDRL